MPVRKVRLKDGSVGYQWGTTGKIYKKREDAEKQGIAILLSQRKKRKMQINKELYNELKEKVESLEKQINGGKGSGNFGHAGRPGEVGGSSSSGYSSTKQERRMGKVKGSSDKFSAGDEVSFYQYGENSDGKIIRKISEKEKRDRAALNNPNAGDYYEILTGEGTDFEGKYIVWEGRIKKKASTSDDDDRIISEAPSKEAIKRDKKILEELEDKIKDNITKISQAAVALKEGKVKDETETRQYIEQLHEERKELRERVARVRARAEGYERALARKASEEKIDKILGTEKIKQTDDKKNDDANYKKLQSDISKIKKVLSTEKSRENFGQEEVRKLKDKYADYMSGNWNVTERFRRAVDAFDDWTSNYENSFIPRPEELDKVINGGAGSGNFGHAGRPGERGGSAPALTGVPVTTGKTGADLYRAIGESNQRLEETKRGYVPKHQKESRIRDAIAKSIAAQKGLQDKAKVVQEDIEDRIGQKVRKGEEYTALDEAMKFRFKEFHGEDGTEYTYDKVNGMITKTNPETGDQEVVTKQTAKNTLTQN